MDNVYVPTGERLTITDWMRICYNDSVEAGWWDGVDPNDAKEQVVKIALIHSEISEALEGIRRGTMDEHLPHRRTVEVELADVLIRLFDLSGSMGLDLEGAVFEKRLYNLSRADHKPEARAAVHGKKF